jgi:sugar lactone lactonase YvrE
LFIAAEMASGQTGPTITQDITNQTVFAGFNAVFSIGVSGTGPFDYAWQQNGTNLPTNIINTVAGGGTVYPGDGGAATNANLHFVADVAVDTSGDLFVVDQTSNRIHKVTSNGIMTLVAGNGTGGFTGDGGAATNAELGQPSAVAVDLTGNLFIADSGNSRIRKVGTNGIIRTVAGNGSAGYGGDGGPATNASLDLVFSTIYRAGVVVDADGTLFIGDTANNRIRKVGTNGIITTIAGKGGQSFFGDGGPATNAYLSDPTALALDGNGNLFVADSINQRVREIDTNGIINTVAGGGSGGLGGAATNFVLEEPFGLAFDADGNLFISVYFFDDIRRKSNEGFVYQVWTNGIISLIAGSAIGSGAPPYGDGGPASDAFLEVVGGIAVDAGDELFISDGSHDRVRKVNLGGPVLTLNNLTTNNVGTYDVIVTGPYGSVTSSVVSLTVLVPATITVQPQNQFVAVGSNATLNVAATGTPPLNYQWYFDSAALTGQTNCTLALTALSPTNSGSYQVIVTNLYGSVTSSVASLSIGFSPQIIGLPPTQAAVLGGNTVLTAAVSGTGPFDYQWQLNGTNLLARTISTFAGAATNALGDGGPATNADLFNPNGIAIDVNGNLYIANTGLNRIRKIGTNGIVTTVAGGGNNNPGNGGLATQANLDGPFGLAVDATGNFFIFDYLNGVTCRVGTNGIISAWSTNALHFPGGLAVDINDDLFCSYEYRVVGEFLTNGTSIAFAGDGSPGYSGDGGAATNAELSEPAGLTLDAGGNLFIADKGECRVRRVGTNGVITTVAGNGYSGFYGDGGLATNAELNAPVGVAVDPNGNLFIADTGNNRIREVTTNGIITTIAGNGAAAFSGDGGAATSAALNQPSDVAVDAFGNLYISDTGNNRIRLAAQGPAFAFTNLSYTNNGNYDLVVSSPYGSVTSSVVALTVFSPPQNLSASLSPAQGVQFQFTGTQGIDYVLLAATNLTPPILWQPIVTNIADTNGNWTYTDTNALANPARFYRAMLP